MVRLHAFDWKDQVSDPKFEAIRRRFFSDVDSTLKDGSLFITFLPLKDLFVAGLNPTTNENLEEKDTWK
jgi:hypothetical protein